MRYLILTMLLTIYGICVAGDYATQFDFINNSDQTVSINLMREVCVVWVGDKWRPIVIQPGEKMLSPARLVLDNSCTGGEGMMQYSISDGILTIGFNSEGKYKYSVKNLIIYPDGPYILDNYIKSYHIYIN